MEGKRLRVRGAFCAGLRQKSDEVSVLKNNDK
jgi:hypothetical protein